MLDSVVGEELEVDSVGILGYQDLRLVGVQTPAAQI